MNKNLNYLPQLEFSNVEEIKKYIKKIFSKYSKEYIKTIINDLKEIKALVIGDAIIDEYDFVIPKGRAIKDPILSVDFYSKELYAGGILAIANNVGAYAKNVKLVTVIGDRDNKKDFINSKMMKNIKIKFFTKNNSPTTTKVRFINKQRNEKLFKIEYINDYPIEKKLEKEIISYLKKEIPKYDLVIVGDFGHGFISNEIIYCIEQNSKFLSVNVQSNSSNLGFNYITKYNKPSFMTMDLREIQYAVEDRFGEIPLLVDKLKKKKNFDNFIITLGKNGSCYVFKNKLYYAPVLSLESKDTMGAGDSLFSITSLLAYKHIKPDLISFLGNCMGAIAANTIGNIPVTKDMLFNFIDKLYSEK